MHCDAIKIKIHTWKYYLRNGLPPSFSRIIKLNVTHSSLPGIYSLHKIATERLRDIKIKIRIACITFIRSYFNLQGMLYNSCARKGNEQFMTLSVATLFSKSFRIIRGKEIFPEFPLKQRRFSSDNL